MGLHPKSFLADDDLAARSAGCEPLLIRVSNASVSTTNRFLTAFAMLILLAYLTRRWLAVAAVIVVLLTIMLLLLTLAEAASEVAAGRLPPGLFWWQLLFSMPEAMGIVVPLAVTAGLVLSIGQSQLDREWVVMRSSGLSMRQLLGAVIVTGAGFTVVMLLITGYVQPWSQQQLELLKQEAARSAQLWGMQAGRFVEIPGMDGVAYVAAVKDEGFVLEDLFVAVHKDGRDEVLTARAGEYQQTADGERFIRLQGGQRIEIPESGLAVRDAKFAGGVLQIPQQEARERRDELSQRTLNQLLLNNEVGAAAEFSWRIASPIAVFTLSLFALICGAWGQAEGRGWRAVLSIVIYVTYVQAINLARVRVDNGAWEVWSYYWIHILFVLIAGSLITLMARRF